MLNRPDAITATAVVEIKYRLSAVRMLRDGLVQLATMLADRPDKSGYLLLIDPRLSQNCLTVETEKFKAAMRPDLANRLHLVVAKDGEILLQTSPLPTTDLRNIRRMINQSVDSGFKLPTPDKQEEVFLVILHQWITGQGPMTSRWLENKVGCNYRTVSAAIERLGLAIKRRSDRRVELKYFPERNWRQFLAIAHKVRSSIFYADASDQPHSPESLLLRLRKFDRKDIAVGGVIGAKRHFPNLDIVGVPRLDLCVHAPGACTDLEFIHQLDPALERTRDLHRPARLALHFVRRKESLFDRESDGSLWPDPIECLLELFLGRLDQQAVAYEEFLVSRARNLVAKD